MKVWVNLWRCRRSSPPYEATVHASEEEAIEAVADDMEDAAGSYACTVLIEAASLEPARRLDLRDAAHEMLEDRRIEREAAEIEARMLRWRQAGL